MKLISQKDMLLLSRKRVIFEVEHLNKSTPSRTKLKSEIAKKLKTKENLIAIRHIYSKYGIGKSKIISHIYNNEEIKNKLDPLKKKEKQALKKQETPKQEPPQQKVKKPETKQKW